MRQWRVGSAARCVRTVVPWKADLMGEGCTTVKVPGSTKEEWLLVISQLYPIVPCPELSLQQLQQVLPVVHNVVPDLHKSEQLQLDALKQAALEGLNLHSGQQFQKRMESNVLDADLLRLSPGLMLEALKVTVEKIACPSSTSAPAETTVNPPQPPPQPPQQQQQCGQGGKRTRTRNAFMQAAPLSTQGLRADSSKYAGASGGISASHLPGRITTRACAAHCPNLRRCVVQVVKAHPSVVKRGEVTLECDDGGLSVLRDVFVVSSPWMADLLGNNCTSVKVSGSTKEEWLLVISQLYPIVPRPELSLQQLQQVLPVVHKVRARCAQVLSIMIAYNLTELLQFVSSKLATQLASTWSLDPSAPGYIIKWLVTAEQLQLDALKQAALEGLKKQPGQQFQMRMESNVLDADLLLLSPGLMLEAWKVTVEKKVEKKDCPSCLQQCNCNLRSYYIGGSMCSTCGKRRCCGNCAGSM
ncbi:hypothetical protein V8C86DRAFT_3023716 [Haematococcus lacustris]